MVRAWHLGRMVSRMNLQPLAPPRIGPLPRWRLSNGNLLANTVFDALRQSVHPSLSRLSWIHSTRKFSAFRRDLWFEVILRIFMIFPRLYRHFFLLLVQLALAQELLQPFHTHLDATRSFLFILSWLKEFLQIGFGAFIKPLTSIRFPTLGSILLNILNYFNTFLINLRFLLYLNHLKLLGLFLSTP